MFGRRKKIKLKVGKKPAFPAHFSCNWSFLFFLSLSWPSATTTLIAYLLTIVPTLSRHQTISHGGCHRDPCSSSNNHLA
jgi:hypothetical protein